MLAQSNQDLERSLYGMQQTHTHTHIFEFHIIYSCAEFRSVFLRALPKSDNGSFRGMFINSWLTHCQSQLQLSWNWDPVFRLEDKVCIVILTNLVGSK